MTINDIDNLLKNVGCDNLTIFESLCKANNIINNPMFNNIICSISGGSDSDIILDICTLLDDRKIIKYVWFDTGIEYNATKKHISYLEEKYNITIHKFNAKKPIPLTVKEYGQPFISKFVSQMIAGLQRHNFKWEDEPYDVLIKKYPKAKSYIGWWCNNRNVGNYGYSMFNINYNRYLKEFMINNPPTFKISDKCCKYAKKDINKEIIKKYNADLLITGIRKSERGIRTKAYKNCFTDNHNNDDVSLFRPIFYYKDSDKLEYNNKFNIINSDCYTKYGMKRTGCCGCPYNKKVDKDLKNIELYENNLFKAVTNIFKDSLEYTKKYNNFIKQCKKNEVE